MFRVLLSRIFKLGSPGSRDFSTFSEPVRYLRCFLFFCFPRGPLEDLKCVPRFLKAGSPPDLNFCFCLQLMCVFNFVLRQIVSLLVSKLVSICVAHPFSRLLMRLRLVIDLVAHIWLSLALRHLVYMLANCVLRCFQFWWF